MKTVKILSVITLAYMVGIFYYTIEIEQLGVVYFQAGCALGAVPIILKVWIMSKKKRLKIA